VEIASTVKMVTALGVLRVYFLGAQHLMEPVSPAAHVKENVF